MVLSNPFPGHTTLTTFADLRRDLEGLVVRNSAGVMRAGVFPDHLNPLVTGRSDMKVNIGDFRAVQNRGGAVLLANVGTDTSVTLPAAPGANKRIDLIYVTMRSTALADAKSTPVFGFVQGTASATPVAPSLPANLTTAIPLATVEIPAGATTTLSVGVVITQVYPYTALAGGTVVVRNTVELGAWTPADGSRAFCILDGCTYSRSANKWFSRARASFMLTGSTWESGGSIFGGGTQATLWEHDATIGSRAITPAISGLWRFTATGYWADNSTGIRQISIRKNSHVNTVPGAYAGVMTNAVGRTEFSVSGEFEMNGASDYIDFAAYQNSGVRLALASITLTASLVSR